jgi:hypothetical protein
MALVWRGRSGYELSVRTPSCMHAVSGGRGKLRSDELSNQSMLFVQVDWLAVAGGAGIYGHGATQDE